MNSAAELLLHRSHHYLVLPGLAVEAALTDPTTTDMAPEDALELGKAQYDELSRLLKACLDLDDLETFREVEREWARMFDDVWLERFPLEDVEQGWSDRQGGRVGPATLQLLRRRGVLRFGLVMWVAHLLQADQEPQRRTRLGEALRLLAGRIESVDWAVDTYDAAQQQEHAEWTNWFLSELPAFEAHFVPTADKLLFALVLLTVGLLPDAAPGPLTPRDWLVWRQDDIERHLATLRDDAQRWQAALGLPIAQDLGERPEGETSDPWLLRIDRAGDLFRAAAETHRDIERAQVRASHLEPERVDLVRSSLLRAARESRVIRDTFQTQGALEVRLEQPPEATLLVSRHWAPKSFFTPGSHVIGLDRMGTDLAHSAARAERQRLLAALPEPTPEPGVDGIAASLHARMSSMRGRGLRPSLILLPLNWRLERELSIARFGQDVPAHPSVPLAHRREFSGLFDDIPVLELAEVPSDRLHLLDLPQAARFIEWGSEEGSGLRFELRSFDAEQAAAFVHEHADVKGDHTDDEAIADLQEKVLITVSLCWQITAVDAEAVETMFVSERLQNDPGA